MKKLIFSFIAAIVFAGSLAGFGAEPAQAASEPTDQEIQILIEYLANAPKLPKKAVRSYGDFQAILTLFENIEDSGSITPYLSAKSAEMLSRLPSLSEDLNDASDPDVESKSHKLKIYSGKKYANFSFKFKDPETRKWVKFELILVKENGQWKVDLIQTYSILFHKEIKRRR